MYSATDSQHNIDIVYVIVILPGIKEMSSLAVTRKKFEHPEDFRKSLANGVLLCELLNNLKPGSVKRINKLPGAIAGLDNLNVFLSACEKNFGLKKTQLFDPNDLEDLSTRAISDESEYLLKQEVDRRARNVAVTVYWLGKSVANKYKGPSIDISAFGALVHSHGNKDIISDDCFRNGTSLNKDDSIDTSSNKHRHVRDSSYDSLGSYERESESSFDELDGSGNNMPVRSDMREMRRYGSASSLAMSRDLRLSTASGESAFSDNKDDSLYQSSPDLSHGSQVHTRSSSTDSAEGNYYGNHSRQSSGSTDYPTRRLSSSTTGRKTSTSTPDPLQFVKLKGADNLALQAKKQIEATKEVNIMRGKIDSTSSVSEEQDWQSNFNNWKSKRRKSAFGRLSDDLEEEPEKRTSQKTFSQIMAEKEKRRSAGPMNFYPLEDDDSGIGVKQEPSITKSTSNNNESKPKPKKSTKEEVAPWAQGSSGDENNSQSDSETNNSHQSCDTDSVFSDKSTPSKILSDDDSWVKKTNAQAVSNKLAGHVKTQKPIGESRKLWENNVNESQKKDERKLRDLPSNSVKIKSLAQSYEQKEKEANAVPVVTRRSDFNRSSLSKSLDLSDHSFSTPLSPVDKKPPSPLSPNAPKALLPRDQRYSHSESSPKQQTPTRNNANRKFVEKTIKINQKPNNERGFGFFLTGGAEKKLPITVQRVSLGSAADVCEVEANDELLSINGRDVSNLAFAQVQGIVEHSVKRGEIVLKIKRYTDEDGYDSMEESLSPSNKPNNNNNNNIESKPETFNNRNHYQDMTDSGSFKPSFELSTHTDDQPRLMDQLIQEQKREANNKQDIRAPSPVQAESFTAEVSFNTKSVPKNEVTPPPQQIVTLQQQMVTPPRPTFTERSQDLSGPDDVTLTEERQTISVKPTVDKTEPLEEPVVMRRNRQPLLQDSPPPPTPPKSELPQLNKMNESPGRTLNDSPGRTVSVDASGFGPPAALLRWQQRRPKSEYQSSFSKPSESTFDKNKRLSSTLPFNSESPFSFGKDYTKDDSMLDKVNNDFMESVSVSKPVESKPTSYRFNDTSRIEEWQQKQEQQRMPETEQQRPPSFEVSIRTDDTLTAQSAAPTRKLGQVEAPYVVDLGIPADDLEMSTEEKFERDQQKIRQQYEEEKKRAREAEKLKQEQESKALNSDKFLRDMEAQIVQTKQEVSNQNPSYNEPMRTLGTEQRYSSEPMTIKLPSNSPGRQLMIDPRNQSNNMDNNIPEYSFRVDLPKIETAPPLRTFEQPSLTPQEILEQEKAKIREEEKRKFEEEKQKWKKEQEREMRLQQEKIQQERENLLREQKRVEQEKAMLERSKQDDYSYNTSSNNHLYVNPKTSSGPASLSPKSPPALDPKSRKAPPPTAPKPDKGNKARLTREDLLAMNRKATPLTKPDFPDGYSPESGSLSPTTREAPSKGELHSLNAVPKQKFRSSAGWIKEEEEAQNAMNERPFVIGNRSDLIHHRDNSNPSEHWVVREAEKRRLAEKNDRYGNSESVTAHAGPTKPSQSSLVSRFRGDIEPQPRSNRYSYPSTYSFESRLSPTSRGSSSNNLYNRNMDPGMTQFSAKTQPNTYASNPSLSQTLPPSFSFNANVRSNQDGSSGVKPPRSLSDDTGPVIAVSGKQKCSHCGEELVENLTHLQCDFLEEGLKFSKV
ncbi:Guanine nucleotide exchange factor vav3 [Mactra antiquata]